ncbi:unnamed protein product [Urochloa humidicola]
MLDSSFAEFKLDLEETKNRAAGDIALSDEISAGGHVWSVRCFLEGDEDEDPNNAVYLSLYLWLPSGSRNVRAVIEAFLMGRDGAPSLSHAQRCAHVCPPKGSKAWCFPEFVKISHLPELGFVKDGCVTFMIGVIVLRDHDSHVAGPSPIDVPSSDIGDHLGRLLDSADGSDVSFAVGGETFRVHRAVLAARSPVFKAQLFGSMADANMDHITLHDIRPETFRIVLRFIYTDALPSDKDLGIMSSSTAIDVFQELLAAADMYQLERMKLVCAQKLWECVSTENVAMMLGCAEMHSCPELKDGCLDFFLVEKNFKIAVLTQGYFQLMQSFPSVIDEIRKRVQ